MKTAPFRKAAIRLLYWINPGDIVIRHHLTNRKFRIHSFRHKDYWIHGKGREKGTMRIFKEMISPGELVIEVGGHIGYIATYLASLVGPNGIVIVFEPGTNNLPYLRGNTGSFPNIVIVEKAVSNFVGQAPFYIEDFSGQNNSLIKGYKALGINLRSAGIPEVPQRMEQVPCTTLDAFLSRTGMRAPSFVKIDVEGAELSVLQGMEETLRQDDVALMVEVTEDHAPIYGLLKDHGYLMYDDRRSPIDDVRKIGGNVFCIKKNSPRAGLFKDRSGGT